MFGGVQLPIARELHPIRLTLVIDTSGHGSKIITKLMASFLKTFNTLHVKADQPVEYSMVLFSGYPNGSPLSVECSSITSDFGFFQHWLEKIKYEGGGVRVHALAEGLHFASQFHSASSDCYVVVFTSSEFSTLDCLSSNNKTARTILEEMHAKGIRISLFSGRRIAQLKQLWSESIPDTHLKIHEPQDRSLQVLLSGFESFTDDVVKQIILEAESRNFMITWDGGKKSCPVSIIPRQFGEEKMVISEWERTLSIPDARVPFAKEFSTTSQVVIRELTQNTEFMELKQQLAERGAEIIVGEGQVLRIISEKRRNFTLHGFYKRKTLPAAAFSK